MQCRWAGCTRPTQKGDRKYCGAHREASISLMLDLVGAMFRSPHPQDFVEMLKGRKKPAAPSLQQPTRTAPIPKEERDRLEREQREINAGLDRKCGYGNGPVRLLDRAEIQALIPHITPIALLNQGYGQGRRKGHRTYNLATSVAVKFCGTGG